MKMYVKFESYDEVDDFAQRWASQVSSKEPRAVVRPAKDPSPEPASEQPAPVDDGKKQLRAKNAEAAVNAMLAAGERDESVYERLPQSWKNRFDAEFLKIEAAREAEPHKADDTDLDPPGEPGDLTFEDLSILGEQIVTALPQGPQQLQVLTRIRAILEEAGAKGDDGKVRYRYVPEDRIAAVHAKLLEIQAENAQATDPLNDL